MARGASWQFAPPGRLPLRASRLGTLSGDELAAATEAAGSSQWRSPRWLFNGTHRGCLERRSRFYASMAHLGTCEFDGRLSLARFGGRLWLYARANVAEHGQRFVQATSSADEGATWSAFSLISISGYEMAQGDVYFFVVSANPALPGSLLALFPLAHQFRGCIGLAASADGLRWSAPTPLLRCAVHGERAVHHPAAGLVVDGDEVAIFVHENVPGTTTDGLPTTAELKAYPYLKTGRTRLMRHTIPAKDLRRWTMAALRTIEPTREVMSRQSAKKN